MDIKRELAKFGKEYATDRMIEAINRVQSLSGMPYAKILKRDILDEIRIRVNMRISPTLIATDLLKLGVFNVEFESKIEEEGRETEILNEEKISESAVKKIRIPKLRYYHWKCVDSYSGTFPSDEVDSDYQREE